MAKPSSTHSREQNVEELGRLPAQPAPGAHTVSGLAALPAPFPLLSLSLPIMALVSSLLAPLSDEFLPLSGSSDSQG